MFAVLRNESARGGQSIAKSVWCPPGESQQVLEPTRSAYHAGRTDLDSVQRAQMNRHKAMDRRAGAVLKARIHAQRWREGDDTGLPPSHFETYTSSDGSHGTRQYDSSTGLANISWDSSATGSLSGTSQTAAGFVGLQNDGELTNSQSDLTFFNPAASPAFSAFLTSVEPHA
jgi:hypothetical protein